MPGECVRNWYPESARGRAREGAQKVKEQLASHPEARTPSSHVTGCVLRLYPSLALSWLSAADARATFLWCQQDSSHWHCFLQEVILWRRILTTRPPGNSPGRKWFFDQGDIILASANSSAGPWTGFPSPLHAICKPVEERPERGLWIFFTHILSSPDKGLSQSQILRRGDMIGPTWASVKLLFLKEVI